MINISQAVADVLKHDDIASNAAQQGWLNLSSYARSIKPQVENMLMKDVQEASIVTALSRLVADAPQVSNIPVNVIQSLAVHTNLTGVTYERSEQASERIREVYHQVSTDNKTFLTVTQGINEVTIIAESSVAQVFREALTGAHKVYDKSNLIGITVKFAPNNLEVPNLIFALTRRLAYKNINIIEVVSTATEMTYIIEKRDVSLALEQLQKDI
ncbi:MAG TPA: hypothetical protein VMB52_05270 [Verrucomicrobiae bacterium]|nr:hypothetical protein [Verrucomicrobiae bacterium]